MKLDVISPLALPKLTRPAGNTTGHRPVLDTRIGARREIASPTVLKVRLMVAPAKPNCAFFMKRSFT